MSYVDAISLCTELLVPAAFLPGILLRLPIMPQLLQTLGTALKQLPGLTRDMLDQERQRSISTSSDGRPTIMSTLVRLSDQGHNQTDNKSPTALEKSTLSTGTSTASTSYLTEEEIAGNLFIFTAAGFDTTANTLSYAVALLAAYPEWQSWIQAEIDTVLGAPSGGAENELPPPDYATAFPKLTRCLAIMVSSNYSAHTSSSVTGS
jgi:cytochrome P450